MEPHAFISLDGTAAFGLIGVRRRKPFKPMIDLVAGPENKRASPNGDHVTVTQDPKLHLFVIDLGAVRTFQICQYEIIVILLNLDMKSTNTLVVELDRVTLFATNGDRSAVEVKDLSSVRTFQNAQCNYRHSLPGRNSNGRSNIAGVFKNHWSRCLPRNTSREFGSRQDSDILSQSHQVSEQER